MKFYSSRTITGRFKELRIFMVGERGYIFAPTAVRQVGINNWTSIASGNGKYVAVGYNTNELGYYATSSDGVNWTSPKRFSQIMNGPKIAFGNGVFVVTDWKNAYVSADGETWTTYAISADNNDDYDIYFINGVFYALKQNSFPKTICISIDGKTWETVYNPTSTASLTSLTYADGNYYLATRNSYDKTYTYASPDGRTWSNSYFSLLPQNGSYNIAYGNGKFVAGGNGGYTLTSVDMKKWNTPQQIIKGLNLEVRYTPGKFTVLTTGTYIPKTATSTDGENWSTFQNVKYNTGTNVDFKIWDICAIP